MTKKLCSDCPPSDYPTDKTRCWSCPRRAKPMEKPKFTTEPKPIQRYASDYEVDSVGRPFGMMRGDPRGYWVNYEDHAETVQQLQRDNERLTAALKPFANYACDEPCNCHNCIARDAIIAEAEEKA